MKPINQHQGFTLIELLLALSVMAIFSLLTYRGLDSILKIHHASYEHQQSMSAIDRTLSQLEFDLRNAHQVNVMLLNKENNKETRYLTLNIQRPIEGVLFNVQWCLNKKTDIDKDKEPDFLIRRTVPMHIQGLNQTATVDFNDLKTCQMPLPVPNNLPDKTIQVMPTLNTITELDWLYYTPIGSEYDESNPNHNEWRPFTSRNVEALNQGLKIQHGLGLRFKIKGQRIEKYFLVGR